MNCSEQVSSLTAASSRNPLLTAHSLLSTSFLRIPLLLTRPCQLSSGCKRTFQSSSLPRISPQEALIPHQIISFGPNWRGWHATEHTLTWKASNNLWSEQVDRFHHEVLR
ncbi:unnamed protein product [Nezara viridula]|uniref:Uncharacterized protein n=1 Tax=Nezara viridula TaxID=85310 RepID=A0A9P0MQV1_NEZVI|nr:unnamed protein product [Nezara viridula]